LDVTHTIAVVAIGGIGRRRVVVQRAAGTVEVLGLRQAMQEAVHERRVFDLRGEAELGLVVAHLAPAVALPIGVLPLPVTSVVLAHHLGFAVASQEGIVHLTIALLTMATEMAKSAFA
jgi:hypothetical protein